MSYLCTTNTHALWFPFLLSSPPHLTPSSCFLSPAACTRPLSLMARFQSKLVAERFVSVFLILQKTLTSSFDAERVVMNIMMWRSSSFCQKRRPRWYSARHPLLILCRGVHLRCHYWPQLHSAGISQQWTRRRFLLVLRSLYLLSSFPPPMTSFYPFPTSFYPLPPLSIPSLPLSIPSLPQSLHLPAHACR